MDLSHFIRKESFTGKQHKKKTTEGRRLPLTPLTQAFDILAGIESNLILKQEGTNVLV